MATFEEYMATPDPWKKAELVRGEIVIRKPGYAAHGLAISAFMGIWLDYSGERSGMREAAPNRERRQAERRTRYSFRFGINCPVLIFFQSPVAMHSA